MPEFFKAVGAARFGVMAGVAAVLTAFFLYIAGAITEPPKTILFGGLEPRDAAAVTAKLDGMNVKYDAKGDGTILVPADQVTKLRMALAQDNLPAAGFEKVSTLQHGDLVLMQIRSPVPNHAAIYLADGVLKTEPDHYPAPGSILHHLYNRDSKRDVYGGYWAEVTVGYWRYRDATP